MLFDMFMISPQENDQLAAGSSGRGNSAEVAVPATAPAAVQGAVESEDSDDAETMHRRAVDSAALARLASSVASRGCCQASLTCSFRQAAWLSRIAMPTMPSESAYH